MHKRLKNPFGDFFFDQVKAVGSSQGALRAGLKELARKDGRAGHARRGGDFRSPRKPAEPDFCQPRTNPESPITRPNKKNVDFPHFYIFASLNKSLTL
jgi:hypothetical protein